MKTSVTRHGSLILLFLSTLAIVSSSRAYAQATVATDFPDYSPGDTVVVTGTGWMSGETVALRFDEDPMWHEARVLYAFADSSGDIRSTYGIEDNDLGARFTLTAEGQTSGETAVVLFTDSPKVGSASITAQSGNVCAGTGTATYTVTVNRGSGGGSNGAFTATLSVTSALPAGVTASFSPNPVSFTSGANSGTSTLTLTASGSTPAGTTSVDVKAATSASDFATTTGSLFVGAPPTISCPSNLTINNAAGQCGATATFAATATGSPAPTVTYSKASGSFFSVGSTTVTVTATNSCGTTSCNFTVTVQDVEKPAISVANLTRNTDAGQCMASIASLGATAADNCGMGTLNGVRSDAAALSSPFPKGTTTITWTATDIHGNSSTATQTVTVNDTEKPTISAPAALNLTTGPTATQCGLVIGDATLGAATANDNCGVTVTRSGVPAGNLFPVGTTTVTYTATDPSGNTVSATQTVTVTDNTPPTITTANLSFSTDAGKCTAAVSSFGTTAADNCGSATLTSSRSDGGAMTDPFPKGTTTITWTATDSHGNTSTATQTVAVADHENPTITTADMTLSTDPGKCTTLITSLGTSAADNCGTPTLTASRSDGAAMTDPFPKGMTTITWLATDASGNTATRTQKITINDTEKPTIEAPTALSLTTGPTATQCGLVISDATLGTATANDNCGVTVERAGAPAGNLFPVGTTTLTYTATDPSGNTATATQTVTVTDNTPPTITTANLTLSTDAGKCTAAISSLGTSATDNCGSATLAGSRSDGAAMADPFPKGMTTITWTATDSHGNSSTATQTVAVADHENPTITAPAALNLATGTTATECGLVISDATLGSATANDNCGVTVERTGVPAGNLFPVGTTTLTYTATDPSGNTASATQAVTVTDNAPPAITTTNLSFSTDAGKCTAEVTALGTTATDNCSVETLTGTRSDGEALASAFPKGTTTISWTATDIHGNTSTATQTVAVADHENPTITTADMTLSTDPGKCTTLIASLGTSAADNCGTPTLTATRSDGAALTDPFPKGMTTITWLATDTSGNTDTATQKITVNDTEKPTIAAPTALSLTTGPTATQCGLVISDATLGTPTANDNCGVTVERTGVPTGNLFPVGTTTLTYTASDPSGNTASSTQTVTVTDNTPPTITTANLSFSTDPGKCTVEVAALGTTATDNCGSATLTASRSDGASMTDPFPKGTTTITWTATDTHGNASTATQTVAVADHENPTITTADMTLSTDPGKCNALIASLGTSAADNCGTPTLTATRSDGASMTDPFPKGMTTITWLATDASGNTYSATQKITINDTEKPTIEAPTALSLTTGPTATQCGLVISDATLGTATANDNCGVTVERTGVPTGNLFPVGTTTLTYSATDPSGNTATTTQTVAVTDNTPPTITTANLSFSTDAGKCTAEVTALGTTATDNCGSATLTSSRSDGAAMTDPFPKGTTTITWTATDTHGNTSTATQTVAVADHENPTITTADMTLSTDPGKCTTLIASLGTSAADNCGTPTLTATRSDGAALTDPFPKGMTTITWLATDTSGNTDTATQKITVNDTEKPTIAAPTALSLTTGPTATQCGLVISDATLGMATANDNCGVTVERTGVPAGNLFPVGTTTLTYTATDPSGNTASSTQTVTVTDNTPPTITTANLSFSTDAGKCTAAVSSLGTTATDNCGTATLASARSDGAAITDAFPKGTTTITWTATDSHGNTSTATQTVAVADHENPTITTAAMTLSTDPGKCNALIASLGTSAADNCGTPTLVATRSDGAAMTDPFPKGCTTITWLATDTSGNTFTTTQKITVNDTEKPTIAAPVALSLTTGPTATQCGLVISDAILGTATANDNCGVTVERTGVPAGNLFPVGTTTLTYTATDPSGNTASSTQTVTVTDNTPPTITTANLSFSTDAGKCTAAVSSLGTMATDNCGTATLASARSDGAAITDAFPKGMTTITWTATDSHGNTSTATQTVTVNDTEKPTITAPPALSLGTGPGATQCGLALSDAALGTVIANDNCSVTVTRSGVPAGNFFPTGMTTITYTATDASGNTASATQTITITDTTPPVLTVPAQVSAMTGASATICGVVIGDAALGTASATDNCSAIVTRTGVPAGNLFPTGTTTVTYTAKDPAGNMSTGTQLVIVTDNTPPKITTANLTMPTTAGLCTAAPASLGTTASDNCGTPTLVGSRSDGAALTAPFPKGTTTIVWSAKDGAGNTSNASQTITVTNGMPAATITAPASGTILAAGSTVTFAGTFSDDAGDVHTAKWICDTQSYPATVNESAKTVGGSVTLSTAGVYMIQLVVTDQCGNQVTTTQINGLTAMAVIYDPNAGFVTGGGWIQSPPGAYVPNPSVTGKANFGFVSKYKKGQSTPTGETEFQFKEGDMDFHSASYDWLVVSGAKAQFKGTGTINGAGDYGFLLSAVDGQTSGGGGTDKFRIKITNRVTGLLVYDNQLGAADTVTASTALGGGSIAIQSGGGNLSSAQLAGDMATSAGESLLFQNFPNPFNPETTIQFSLAQAGPATLRIYNIRGTLVRTLLDESLAEGLHEARWNGVDSQGRHVATGVYFARFSSGGHESGIRMLLVK